MFWPILGCSAIAAGLWAGRLIVPAALAIPADVVGFVVICVMFVWLVRRAGDRGEERGITDYRRLRRAAARRILSSGQAEPGEREVGR